VKPVRRQREVPHDEELTDPLCRAEREVLG
jgi:hypothetical protein